MLEQFLNNKPLYYSEIDYGRMPRIFAKIKSKLPQPKIIHIIGTNGKGTTGRFLAQSLFSLGFSVGHYTSPHILEFNERIWLDGKNVDNETLEQKHKELQSILTKEDSDSLSYFEYTTLLGILVFSSCDYVVLEAGLGGEYDATAVFKKELTLVTPIDYDHEAFLGSTIEEIATTKLNAIQKSAIVTKQNYEEIERIVELKKDSKIYRPEELLNEDDYKKISQIKQELELPNYLVQNLELSISALKFFNIVYDSSNFKNSKLFGRLTKYKKNILLDVGHNVLASKAIVKELKGKKKTLIYNTYADKNYKEILNILKPIIESVEVIKIDEQRIENKEKLEDSLKELNIKFYDFNTINEEKNYLVFGSFSVVEKFLKVCR